MALWPPSKEQQAGNRWYKPAVQLNHGSLLDQHFFNSRRLPLIPVGTLGMLQMFFSLVYVNIVL
jgi:hypothetical protein